MGWDYIIVKTNQQRRAEVNYFVGYGVCMVSGVMVLLRFRTSSRTQKIIIIFGGVVPA